MICCQCENTIDGHALIPKMMPDCKHIFCSNCFNKLMMTHKYEVQCPIDATCYSKTCDFSVPIVDSIASPIPAPIYSKSKKQTCPKNICPHHHIEHTVFCQDCQVETCEKCCIEGPHSTHRKVQLVTKKREVKEKVVTYRKKIDKINERLGIQSEELGDSLRKIKEERLNEVKTRFNNLIQILTLNQTEILRSLNEFYEKIASSVDIVKHKVLQVQEQIFSKNIEEEILQNHAKDKFLTKEIENIEETLSSKLMLTSKQQNDLIEFQFDTSLMNSCKSYCKMICHTEICEKNQKPAFKNYQDEENLLHESFRNEIKEAHESLLQNESIAVEESFRKINTLTHSPRQNPYIREEKNYSPMSKLSNKSDLKNGGSMLKRKTSTLSNSGLMKDGTHKKSLNNYDGEESVNQKSLNTSPVLSRNYRHSEMLSMKTTSMASQHPQNITNKENIKNQQKAERKDAPQNGYVHELNMMIKQVAKRKEKVLDLSKIDLSSSAVVMELKESLQMCQSVETIRLDQTRISLEGFKYMCKFILGLKVKFISATNNKLNDICVDYALSTFSKNRFLREIDFRGNDLENLGRIIKGKISAFLKRHESERISQDEMLKIIYR